MEYLKEQLKAHYGKTAPREAYLQTLLTLEAAQAPVPVRNGRKKKLLFPIAAMLIAAIAVLGGGHYLMDALPISRNAPEVAPTAASDIEESTAFSDFAPVESAVESTPVPNSTSSAPIQPQIDQEPASAEDPVPEPSSPAPKPEQGSSTETKPVSPPPSGASPEPDSIPEPPAEEFPSIDAPAEDEPPYEPPEEDVPPYESGGEDAPSFDPPESTDPLPLPTISAYYANEDGQHMVYLTNCDTGESSPVNLTTWVTENGHSGTHNLFGYMILIELTPTSDGSFYASATAISYS